MAEEREKLSQRETVAYRKVLSVNLQELSKTQGWKIRDRFFFLPRFIPMRR